MATKPDEFSSSIEEKKPILSRKYSTKQEQEDDSFLENKEDDRSVMIRLPKCSSEKTRVDRVDSYLGGNLSTLVNAYEATDFKGELIYKINETDKVKFKKALFLDNDRIAILVEKRNSKSRSFLVYIYNPTNGELIAKRLITKIETKYSKQQPYTLFNIVITPMRNILITFYGDKKYYIYYCDQDMVEIWNKVVIFDQHEEYQKIPILNDDTIIIKKDKSVILKSKDKEIVWDFNKRETLPHPFEFKLYSLQSNFIPYGVKGFLAFKSNKIYLYDDNFVEYTILNTESRIITIKLIDDKTLLYVTSNNNLVTFDLTRNVEISRVKFKRRPLIGQIELLPYNKCLFLMGGEDSLDGVRIHDLANLNLTPDIDYISDNFITYKGILSNGDVLFFTMTKLLSYNIRTMEITGYEIEGGNLDSESAISSNLVLVLNKDDDEKGNLSVYM